MNLNIKLDLELIKTLNITNSLNVNLFKIYSEFYLSSKINRRVGAVILKKDSGNNRYLN